MIQCQSNITGKSKHITKKKEKMSSCWPVCRYKQFHFFISIWSSGHLVIYSVCVKSKACIIYIIHLTSGVCLHIYVSVSLLLLYNKESCFLHTQINYGYDVVMVFQLSLSCQLMKVFSHPDHGNSKCYTVLRIKWNKSSCLWYSYDILRTLSCTSSHNRTIRFYFNQSSFLQLSMWFLLIPS